MPEFEVHSPMFGDEVTVIVATYGSNDWRTRGGNTATATFLSQTTVPSVIWCHDETLAKARNYGAELATTDWLVFLDADDELDPEFCTHIPGMEADVLQTSVRGYRMRDGEKSFIEPGPVLYPKKSPLIRENYLIIGSPIRKELFLQVGGFDELPILEDWDLWLRCEKAGARFGEQPKSCYLINDSHDRNSGRPGFDVEVARQIRSRYQ